jgi:NAD(P)-dependent dehydrogenase (short-subunit alcohol dehydrogenase family)
MKVSPKSVFITGCNRGIGLELIKQFLKLETPPKNLFATCRKVSDELKELDDKHPNLHVVSLDVTEYDSYPAVVKKVEDIVGDGGLNLLINNAGLLPPNRDLVTVTPEAMRAAYEVNCIAPLFLTRAMLPLLDKAAAGEPDSQNRSIHRAAIIQMSTAVASIAENTGGGHYAYRCSKSGLNQCMKSMSVDLKDKGVLVMAMHPGWVLTEMGGPNAQITTETCVSGMLETLDQLADKDHGAFLRYNNTPIPW